MPPWKEPVKPPCTHINKTYFVDLPSNGLLMQSNSMVSRYTALLLFFAVVIKLPVAIHKYWDLCDWEQDARHHNKFALEHPNETLGPRTQGGRMEPDPTGDLSQKTRVANCAPDFEDLL